MDQERYLETIEFPGILEQVDERFDNVSIAMTKGSVVYGSAITSIIAGLPPANGDIDIAVCSDEFMELAENLASSTVWIQVDGPKIQERHGNKPRRFKPSGRGLSNPYGDAPHLPVSATVAFENAQGARIQVVQSNTGERGIQGALSVVRKVDMVFCAVAMDRYGKILETVPNAFQHCKERRMRLNGIQKHFNPKRMKERINKYAKRGWHLDIDMDGTIAKWRLIQAHAAEKEREKTRKRYGISAQQTDVFSKKKSKKAMSQPTLWGDREPPKSYKVLAEGGLVTGTHTGRIKSSSNWPSRDLTEAEKIAELKKAYGAVDQKGHKQGGAKPQLPQEEDTEDLFEELFSKERSQRKVR